MLIFLSVLFFLLCLCVRRACVVAAVRENSHMEPRQENQFGDFFAKADTDLMQHATPNDHLNTSSSPMSAEEKEEIELKNI